jgi:hypothetical protein
VFADSNCRVRSVSEVNIKTKLRALVFGEDDRVTNPGDILFEMVSEGTGNRLGKNADHFEIYVAGRNIEGLLGQVERAAYLYRVNKEWLSEPSSRYLTPEEIAEREKTNPIHKVKARVKPPEIDRLAIIHTPPPRLT